VSALTCVSVPQTVFHRKVRKETTKRTKKKIVFFVKNFVNFVVRCIGFSHYKDGARPVSTN